MTASLLCAGRRPTTLFAALLMVASTSSGAADPEPDSGCPREAVDAHVQDQYRIYGPQSEKNEFFGFIYRLNGCSAAPWCAAASVAGPDRCTVDTGGAAAGIPKEAKVLGEWHTHPHRTGSRGLSADDVRGAQHDARLGCYRAFYVTPEGEIHSWNASSTSVPTAMNSRVALGNYRQDSLRDTRTLASVGIQPQP
jgi:hypothetical protein